MHHSELESILVAFQYFPSRVDGGSPLKFTTCFPSFKGTRAPPYTNYMDYQSELLIHTPTVIICNTPNGKDICQLQAGPGFRAGD